MYKEKILAIVLGLMISVTLAGNSVFSFDGFPNQDYNIDVYGTGMGESGLADLFRKNTSFKNPSLMTTLNQVYFSSGIVMGNFYYYDDSKQSFRTDGLHFPYFNITIPVSHHRLGFSFSPLYSGNQDIYVTDKTWVFDGQEVNYNELSQVRSYIYKGSLLYGYKSNFANFGISLDYYLGHRLRAWSQDYTGVGSFINNRYEINENFRAPGMTAGISRAFDNFAVGLAYRMSTKLEGESELVTTPGELFTIGDREFALPHQIGVGSSYRFTENFRANLDFYYELWDNHSYYDEASDTYRVAFGIAYEPNWGRDVWYKNIPLRTGFYHQTLPFKVNGNSLDETGLTLGFSLPLVNPNSQLDFAVKYYERGNTADNIYQDKGLLFGIGLSGFDFFRSRPKRIADRDIPQAEFESFR